MKTWDYYGQLDPYYGVLSDEQFRHARMDDVARDQFFRSGEASIEQLIPTIERALGPIRRGAALDYGCGVGRLTRALASRFEHVHAVDISEHMLQEARRNLSAHQNVEFERADAMADSRVDLIVSKIVFQHILPKTGLLTLGRLASRLADGGGAIIDFPVRHTGSVARRLLRRLRPWLPSAEPLIPMYIYDLDEIQQVLRSAGCTRVHFERVAVPSFEKAVVVFGR